MTEAQLREAFETHGKVDSVTIIRDRDSGRSKGFAFVEMASNTEAQAAITALNGKEFHERTLTVNEARPRPERSFGGDFRRGGDRGGYQSGPRRGGGGGGGRGPGGKTFRR